MQLLIAGYEGMSPSAAWAHGLLQGQEEWASMQREAVVDQENPSSIRDPGSSPS